MEDPAWAGFTSTARLLSYMVLPIMRGITYTTISRELHLTAGMPSKFRWMNEVVLLLTAGQEDAVFYLQHLHLPAEHGERS